MRFGNGKYSVIISLFPDGFLTRDDEISVSLFSYVWGRNVWNGNALYLIRCLDAGLRIEWKEDRAGIKVTATLIPSCKTTGLTNTNCIRDISTFYYTSYNILLKNWIKIMQGRLKKIFIEELQIVNRYPKMFEINSTPNLRIKKEKRKESITILRVMSSFS